MTQADLVDRLAEWCRLSERGYTRDDDGSWVRDAPGLDRFAWRPDESDDDCRVVMEEVERQCLLNPLENRLFDAFHEAAAYRDEPMVYGEWLLLLKPAEKCEAVLRVLGDS